MAILNQMIEILTGGIVATGTAIGQGLSSLAQSIFLVDGASGNELSVFGVLILCFAGISLALSLTRLVYQFLTSLGARNH